MFSLKQTALKAKMEATPGHTCFPFFEDLRQDHCYRPEGTVTVHCTGNSQVVELGGAVFVLLSYHNLTTGTGPHSASVTAEQYGYNCTQTNKKLAAKQESQKNVTELYLRRTSLSPTALSHSWFQVYPTQDLTSYQDCLASADKIWNKHRATIEATHSKYLLLFLGLLIYFTFFPAWGTEKEIQHLYQPHSLPTKLAK